VHETNTVALKAYRRVGATEEQTTASSVPEFERYSSEPGWKLMNFGTAAASDSQTEERLSSLQKSVEAKFPQLEAFLKRVKFSDEGKQEEEIDPEGLVLQAATIEIVPHLEKPVLNQYVNFLARVAAAIDPDSCDKIKVERVVEKLKSFNEDKTAKFLLLKNKDEKIEGIATIFIRENKDRKPYVYVAQIAPANPSQYTDVIVRVLREICRQYPDRPLYGIVKDGIWQAQKAYVRVGAVEDKTASFPEWEEYRSSGRSTQFKVMNFADTASTLPIESLESPDAIWAQSIKKSFGVKES
jgi:hypothetical protein